MLSSPSIRRFVQSRAFRCGVRMLSALPDGRANLLRVLTYHRVAEVDERPDLDPSLISATPSQFARQMQLVAETCRPVSLDEVLDAVRGVRPLPARAVLVTFDDAYRDFAEHAWPTLRRLGIPVVLFVPTGFPDRDDRVFWWDRLHGALLHSTATNIDTPFGRFPLEDARQRRAAFGQLKQLVKSLPDAELRATVDGICEQVGTEERLTPAAVLGWDELRRLAGEGVTLAPHTHTHPLLNRVPIEEAREEVRRSIEELRDQVGRVPPAFAYPSGHFNAATGQMLREEGIELAFTTVRGLNDLRSADPLRLRRTNVGRNSTDELLQFQLLSTTRWMYPRMPVDMPVLQEVARVES